MTPLGKAFISGAYSGNSISEVELNLSKARIVTEDVLRIGWIPVCPNLIFSPFAELHDYEFWLAGAFILMKTCDVIVLVPGWQVSSGVRREVKLAQELNIPVFETIGQLKAFRCTE